MGGNLLAGPRICVHVGVHIRCLEQMSTPDKPNLHQMRVSYELDRAQRQVARVRNGVNAATLEHAQDAPPEPATPEARRDALRRRIEPTLGRAA